MKLRRGGKKPVGRYPQGRQRRTTSGGGKAPSVFSYHAQRSERADAPGRQQASLADQRHRLLSLQFWVKRSGLVIAIVVGIVCLISILSLSARPRVVLLDEGNEYAFHDATEYQRAAEVYLDSSFWNKNKITVNTGAAAKDLQKKYPELASVNVTLPLIGHRPIYYLNANAPAFVLQAVNGTYVLDSRGTALIAKDAAPAETVAKLPIISDQTGARVQLGKQIISSSEADFIQLVVATLAAKGVTVSSLILPPDAVQQLDVRVNGQPYLIKFNMHEISTARQQAGTYLATASNLAAQQVTPAQYIDVRVPGRAYYQ